MVVVVFDRRPRPEDRYLCLQPLQWMKVAGVLVLHSKTVPSLHVLKFENKAGAT